MDNLLYFPYISIPKTPWLYKSLLYWDTIETITPEHFLRNPDLFDGTYMGELLEAELVKPIMPMHYIHQIPDFKENFFSYVDSNYNTKEKIKKLNEEDMTNLMKVHLEKMDDIGYGLVKRELAIQKGNWFYMNQSVANDFMFYLATLISKIRNSQPITDSIFNIDNTVLVGKKEQKFNNNREDWRRTVLNNSFPTPTEITNVHELYSFKQKHEKQLKGFRKYIEQELLNIDSTPEHLQTEKLQSLISNIEDEKQSISCKMKGKWNVFNSATLIQLTAGSTTMADVFQNGTKLAATGATLTVVSTVISTLKKMQENKQNILSEPLAYAFLVEQKWTNKKEQEGYLNTPRL